jgi:hypothetical protein
MSILDLIRKSNHKAPINNLSELVISQGEEKAPCVIYDNLTRKRIYRNVDSKLIPERSIPRFYRGQYRHFLGWNEDKLYIISPNDENIDPDDSPQGLEIVLRKFEALVPKAFPMTTNLIEKVKITILVVFCFAELVTIFFIVSQLSGSKV